MADILVIENNPTNLRQMESLLNSMNFHTLEAQTGRAGIDTAHKKLPSVILLDINLPDIDGYEVASRLKASSATKNIPVIAVTANSHMRDEVKAFKAGCNGLLVKPVKFSALITKMSSLGIPVMYPGE